MANVCLAGFGKFWQRRRELADAFGEEPAAR